MSARVKSATLFGTDAVHVDVETRILSSLRRFAIVGLPDGVVREARERVRCAIEHSGFPFPHGEVIVSLSPASLPKFGAGFDLAIAVSILAADGRVDSAELRDTIFLGELALDGRAKTAPVSLAAALSARGSGLRLIVPEADALRVSLVHNAAVIAVDSLLRAVLFLNRQIDLPFVAPLPERPSAAEAHNDFGDVIGQHAARRAMEVAAAGAHNMLMVGPPGAGKSMLAQRLTSILPLLDEEERIEVLKIYAALGGAEYSNTVVSAFLDGSNRNRPFRAPHHSMSTAGLVGGGGWPVPGEISLAHRGVLFLDELTEIKRDALEALRQPLESRRVVISRAKQRLSFPADFILVAAMNPCPCGWRGTAEGRCQCAPTALQRYAGRISGPIFDRFDLQIWIPPVPISQLSEELPMNPTESMRQRVLSARQRQCERFQSSVKNNSHMTARDIKRFCRLDQSRLKLIEAAAERFRLSARGYNRILKVARTIADLKGDDELDSSSLSEAISYRMSLTSG